ESLYLHGHCRRVPGPWPYRPPGLRGKPRGLLNLERRLMLQDSFGRRFYYLRLSVTDICNFRCNYCLPDGYQCGQSSARENPLSVVEVGTVVRAFASLGTEKVRLTGGEP